MPESPSLSPSASPSESPSISPSLSPSASESPSVSPSLSPSASESPSESPSLSPSASASPSASPSITEFVDYAIVADSTDWPRVYLVKWEGLEETQAGTAFACPNYTIKSVQVTGTFDTSTCIIQGSNMKEDQSWATLTDPQGNALSFTATKIEQIQENTYWIRPNVTGGANTSLNVYLLCVKR